MSTNVEDLYLKGFMAFSAKNYDSAKTYWEQVLAADPNHEKARQGLAELQNRSADGGQAGGGKKRTSKEVFQEIKRLYAAKKFPEALKLCELLLKKHPDNADLQGLRAKLTARVQADASSAPAPAAQNPPPEARTTMHMAAVAQESVAGAEDNAARVEKLIQQGVSSYEVQNLEVAIDYWKQALALDPSNRIAQDYITNVSAELSGGYDEPEPEPMPRPEPDLAPAPEPQGRPSKEDMVRLYTEGMEAYKTGDYDGALEKWRYILKFHPNHKETLQCVERTEAMLAEQGGAQFAGEDPKIAQAKAALQAGSVSDAERIATELAIMAPDTPGLDALQAEIEKRRNARMDNVSSLALDIDDEPEPDNTKSPTQEVIRPDIPEEPVGSHVSHSASDDQLGEFFSEPVGTTTQKARQVSKVSQARRERKPINLKLLIGVPVILGILGVAGWFGYDLYNKRLKTSEQDKMPVVLTAVHWNSIQQKSADFLEFGNEFADRSDPLLASVAYERAMEEARPRLAELEGRTNLSPDLAEELRRIRDTMEKAEQGYNLVFPKVQPQESSSKDMERVQAEMSRGRYEAAAERLHAMLSGDRENAYVRDLLGDAHRREAFRQLKDENLDGAFEQFKRASVLMTSNDMVRHHTEVIKIYYQGKITNSELAQWFFFFKNH